MSETTTAEVLKRAGYATAHFGKWHMGRANPREHGFDENDGANGNGGPDNVANPHPRQLYAMTERGMEFMMRQVKAGKPFYLQLSHYASREGGVALPETLGTVKSWGGNLNERELAEASADLDLDIDIRAGAQEARRVGHRHEHLLHWHGERIAVHVSVERPGPGVDTPEDLERVRALFA